MKNEMKIIETQSRISLTGSFFRVYINGQCVATRSTRERAEKAGKEILEKLEKKTYR